MTAKRELRRDRLIQRLGAPDVRFVALFAAAGYGKSTLARQLTESRASPCVCDFADAGSLREVKQCIADALPGDALKDTVIFENAEALHRIPDAEAELSRLLAQAPSARISIICSRTQLEIPFMRFALPHEVAYADERDLAFDRGELAAFFSPAEDHVEAVYALTRGWPLCVRLISRLSETRAFKDVVNEMRSVEFSLLYEYLVRNVIEALDPFTRSTLIALAVSDLTDGDVQRLFEPDGEKALRIVSCSPFVTPQNGRRVLHPMIRTSVRRWYEDEATRMLRLTAERALCDDRVHAGALYADLGDFEAAASALESQALAFVREPVNADFSAVLQRLPQEVLLRHPQLYAVVMLFAGLAMSSEQRYRDAYAMRSRFDGSEDPVTRMSVDVAIANALSNLGHHREALDRVAYLQNDPDPAAQLTYHAFTGAILSRMGRYGEALTHWPHVSERGRNAPSTLALAGNEILVRSAVARGDFPGAEEVFAATLGHARRSVNPTAHVITVAEGIFDAWLRGDAAAFDALAAELDGIRVPSVMPGTRLLRACIGGNVSNLTADVARPQLHAYAYLIALSWARGDPQRRIALDAIDAADRANEPFLQCLSRVAMSFTGRYASPRILSEAARYASAADSQPLRDAVAGLSAGCIPPFFRAMAERIADIAAAPDEYRLSVLEGSLRRRNETLHPSKREFELLAYLALRDCEVSKDELAEVFAPDADSDDADRLLRVTITRIRKKFGDELVVSGHGGYALGPSVDVALRAIRARAARCETQDTPSEPDRVALARDLQSIEQFLEGRRPGFEWGEEFDVFLERLAASIRHTLQRAGVPTGSA